MARRRRKKKLPVEPVAATIESLAHDGRGVTHIDGKVVFVNGALPGEEVMFQYTGKRRDFDEGVTTEVKQASPDRVEPVCEGYAVCGGCTLQHLGSARQIEVKQGVLMDNFERLGKVSPETVLPPLTGPVTGYRRKARLGVRNVEKKGRVLVGFREKSSPFLADIHACEVLHPAVGHKLDALSEMIGSLELKNRIAQIEVAVTDDVTALIFRNLDPMGEGDKTILTQFAQQHDFTVFLQPGGPASVEPLWPESAELVYGLPEFDVTFRFDPNDFTQINQQINESMVHQALELLQAGPGDHVLDLFCGLGNFTLPIARSAGQVTGVEGDQVLIDKARMNAERNGIENCSFHVCDLFHPIHDEVWSGQPYDKILLDPPRSGAQAICECIEQFGAERIVYVSCHPGSLARDAGILVNQKGYRLVAAGVMDMFPHTAHVESMALFEKGG